MLVLSRKENEQIVIGKDVWVTVLHVGRGRVKLGIQGPPNVAIRRAELAEYPQAVDAEAELLAVAD